MYAHVEKSKENKSRSVATSVSQKTSNLKQCYGFVDNWHETIAHRKLQALFRVQYIAPLQPISLPTILSSLHNQSLRPKPQNELVRYAKYR